LIYFGTDWSIIYGVYCEPLGINWTYLASRSVTRWPIFHSAAATAHHRHKRKLRYSGCVWLMEEPPPTCTARGRRESHQVGVSSLSGGLSGDDRGGEAKCGRGHAQLPDHSTGRASVHLLLHLKYKPVCPCIDCSLQSQFAVWSSNPFCC